MRVYRTWLLLLIVGLHRAIAIGTTSPNSIYLDIKSSLTESADDPTIIETDEGSTTLDNYNDWIYPEDLAPMPQCIAQQDHSTWLAAMTTCASYQCIYRFAFICIHHQWMIELSCLSSEFSPDLLKAYLPYCSRSVLSKAQLYVWIWDVTSRTWLVDVGDANELQNLSPASLVEGYADLDVVHYAPTCLTESVAAQSKEAYQHVMASCMFTGSTQNTGNAARSWEYSESQQSIIPLGFDTVGYNLTGRDIHDGSYFDKDCFCSFFTVNIDNEPCSGFHQLDLTRERLWINATCGSSSLAKNWAEKVQTTDFGYIPLEDWQWPSCVADMPQQVTSLPGHCAAEACELDADGYCSKIQPGVERACFCHSISYDSCGGLCHVFESRIEYIKWLHDICGDVEDWHGLPDDWRKLAAPTSRDIIPWRWTVKPSGTSETKRDCPSNGWKLGSLALVNFAAFFAVMHSKICGLSPLAHRWQPCSWYSRGLSIAACHIIANYINALRVQITHGYEDVPVTQLMLLWSTVPRLLSWSLILFVGAQPFEAMNLSAVGAYLFAEVILQGLSSYYMISTVKYGIEHRFYFGGGLENAERAWIARMMYHGALMWLMIVGMVLALLVRTTQRIIRMTEIPSIKPSASKPQRVGKGISTFAEGIMAQVRERYTRFKEKAIHFCVIEYMNSEESLLIRNNRLTYGTFSSTTENHWASHRASVGMYAALTLGMVLLWLAQWLFWSGFVILSSEEYVLYTSLKLFDANRSRYCPPGLGSLTAVWIIFSLARSLLGVA